jgi:hypothetical protein
MTTRESVQSFDLGSLRAYIRGGAFVLAVLARPTLGKTKHRKSRFFVQWYSMHWNPARRIIFYASLVSSNQPIIGVVIQLVQAYPRITFAVSAQAQLEETRYSVGLRCGAVMQHSKVLAKPVLLTC